MRKPPSVHIPHTELSRQLAETEAIKREMTKLLRQLEERATGQPVTKPGRWRHRAKPS